MKARQGLRFLKSLHKRSHSDSFILNWIEERREAVNCKITEKPLHQLSGWKLNDDGVAHESGKFFQIKMLSANLNGSFWMQPIINQPEIGILGFIVKEIDGVLHFLVQAKIEPGNINIVQLSPTVQSTKSNFTKVHGGKLTPFVEYFLNGKSEILIDQLQSEQGSRFYKKRNRNIIIEVQDNLENSDYMWMTLGDLVAMTKYDNTVNMDSRTVMSCIHFGSYDIRYFELNEYMDQLASPWVQSLLRRDTYENSIPRILSMISEKRFRREAETGFVPLSYTDKWNYEDGILTHRDGKYFDVVGAQIFIENRENTNWSQPMVKPKDQGVCCFFAKRENGVYHLLVQLKDEIGSFDGVEMAPTIQLSSENLVTSPYYKTYKKLIGGTKVLMDIMQSEEGGRFFQEQNRNIIIDVTDEVKSGRLENHEDYIWMTLHQIKTFLQYNNYVNIQTRSIISSLPL